MSLVGFKAQNHPQQPRNDKVDDRATTPEMFGLISDRFGGFTIDVAAAAHNTKCQRFYSIEDDGLEQSWSGERVWCNPPYSDIKPWVQKAWREWAQVKGQRPELIVMLLPANRTEQGWWQDHVEPYRDELLGSPLRVEFLRGRPRFIKPGATEVGPNERPPFGCCLLIWKYSILNPKDTP
jgi:phage N-6-adenine-methyltransferase